MNGYPCFVRLSALLLTVGLVSLNASADWPHYRGPNLNGISSEKLPLSLPKDGPRQLWKTALGTGTSGITTSGERVFSMGNVGDKDIVYCLDAKSGQELWRHEYSAPLDKRMFEGGPAATPTIDGDRVYTVGHRGELFCLEAATGKKLWQKHYQEDLGGKRPQWGFSGSPTVEGNLLILDVGGTGSSTVALDKTNGNVVWKSGNEVAGYASAVVATIDGKRTAVLFKGEGLVGLDVKTGEELWRSPWKTNYEVNAATPLVIGDKVFISSGYGSGCALIEIHAGKATELWRNKNLKAHVSSPVLWQGHIYGIDGQADPKSPLVCLDMTNGSVKWSNKGVAGGSLILVDGKLVVLSERGELLIGEASTNSFQPSSRAQVLGGRCWVQPSFSNGKIFVRNNSGDLVCLGF